MTQAELGGATCSILSYNIEWDDGSNGETWSEVIGVFELYTDLEYLHTAGVQSGVLYQIRIRAKNKHGWSEFSDILEVLAATEPSEPQVTSSIQDGLFTKLQWSLPNEYGSTVVEYEIKVQAASLDLIVTELCNGSE